MRLLAVGLELLYPEIPGVRITNSLQTMPFTFTMLLHLVFATVDIRAAESVSSRALDASLWVMDLLLVLGQIRRIVEGLQAERANVLFGFEMHAIHVAV